VHAISPARPRRRGLWAWTVSAAATVASAYALDAIAAAAGVGLVASGLLGGLGHRWVLAFLVLSYAAWAAGLRTNLRANSALLAATGTSTNVLSKAAHDLTRRLTGNPRSARLAASIGYAGTELAKEAPYYLAAFGAAAASDSITSHEALLFLGGANLGAAVYEYGLARLTRAFLGRRRRPALVGDGLKVPLVHGGERRYVNLDYAASAPCLVSVKRAVDELLPWYSSVHRGAGFKSQLTTDAYEGARDAVRDFVGGRADDVVVFTRNTTDSANLLASALPPGTEVITFAAEHHANLLPWRRGDFTMLPLPAGPVEALERLERALRHGGSGRDRLVSVTGASNVTGEIWPYAEMARLAHRHGARLMLDAAQLAPHRRIDMAAEQVDYLAFSGHKLYAPFGAGALVGRGDWLAAGEPFLAGGGAVRYVGADTVVWNDLPDRQEAGSPNVIGAVALAAACRTLRAADRDGLEAVQTRLIDRTRARLLAVPGVEVFRLWGIEHPRIGVLPFALRGVPYARLAAILSAEFGIGVRHGCFCAHPLMTALLSIDAAGEGRLRDSLVRGEPTAVPGAVRASTGIGTTAEDCDRLVSAVAEIAANGARWTYTSSEDGTDCRPTPDPRRRPKLPFDPAW
jgi:selenocysteine lyase/cysteine desulfurase